MSQFKLIVFITLFMSSMLIKAQESGWVEKDGYKQQLYKTGEIKQLLYSSTGDTIITVTKDSVWHRYLWEAKSGKLLRKDSIVNSNYKRVLSLTISPSCKSYTVSAVYNDNTLHINIFLLKDNRLIHDIQIQQRRADTCFAHYYDKKGILWVGINSLYNYDEYTRKREGLLQQFRIHDGIMDTLFSHNSYTYRFVSSSDGTSCSWLSISMYFRYDSKFQTISDTTEIIEMVKSDSLIYSKRVLENINAKDIHTEEMLKYKITDFTILSNDGEHKFTSTQNSTSHYLLPGNITIHTSKTISFEPQSTISLDNCLVFYKYRNKVYIYHSISKKYIDTIEISQTTNYITSKGWSLLTAHDFGYMRLYELQKEKILQRSSAALIPQLSYVDSINIFAVNIYGNFSLCKWDFGNGDVRYGNWISYAHNKSAKYTISATIIQSNDTTNVVDTIQILPQLVPDFEASDRFGTIPLTVKFTDKSKGSIQRRIWNFGDGTIDSVNQNPTHQYITAMIPFTVSLTVIDTLSAKVITQYNYINPVEFPIEKITYSRTHSSSESNINNIDYSLTFTNSYAKGLFINNKFILYKYNCTHQIINFAGKDTDYYRPIQSITDTNNNLYFSLSPSEVPSPFQKCDNIYGKNLLSYRNNKIVTSFEGFQNEVSKEFINSGIYILNDKNFAPSGWSHDFNAVFLPDGTDIFLFRNKQSNLQFFYKDTSAFQKIDFATQYSDIFALNDSSTIALFSNPTFDVSDSTHSYELTFIDNKAHTMKTLTIPKTINVALQTLFPLNNGKFLVAGFTAERNDKRQIINKKGYIALININGFIEWEKVIPTYEEIRTIQKHPNNYFAALGLPVNKQKHGFIALRENGNVLADFRLFNADDSFYPNDFIIGNNEHDIWFIGKQYVSNQGERATLYSCLNPVTPTTDIDSSQQDLSQTTQDFSVSPNPASDIIYLHNHSGMVTLYDLMGNIILHSDSSTLDCSQLIQGIYVIKSEKRHIKPIMIIIKK